MSDVFRATEPLNGPIEKTFTANQVSIQALSLRADAGEFVVLYKSGNTDGEGFHEVFAHSYSFSDAVDDEGNPVKTEYSDLMAHHGICQYCQGKDISNAEVLRKLALYYLNEAGEI